MAVGKWITQIYCTFQSIGKEALILCQATCNSFLPIAQKVLHILPRLTLYSKEIYDVITQLSSFVVVDFSARRTVTRLRLPPLRHDVLSMTSMLRDD